jgi:hypothetical protein
VLMLIAIPLQLDQPSHSSATWTIRQKSTGMENERIAFFDPKTVAMLRGALYDVWSRLPRPGSSGLQSCSIPKPPRIDLYALI